MSSMQQARDEFNCLLISMDYDSYIPRHGAAELGSATQKIRDATTALFS
jgi:hypothetical protein